MKNPLYLVTFLIIFLSHAVSAQAPFKATFQVLEIVATGIPTLTIPTSGGGYSYTVDWGDGSVDNNVYTGNATHDYASQGFYQVSISGDFPRSVFNQTFIQSIDQWGDIEWQSLTGAFQTCPMLKVFATDAPNLSAVTDLSDMFSGCGAMNDPDFTGWDVSGITNMSGMFLQSGFHGDVSTWDVSNVTNMTYMFYETPFDGDVSNWNTGNVTAMTFMFSNATKFNSPIGNWDIRNVTSMGSVLNGASSFDQDLGGWDISNFPGIDISGTAMSPENYSSTLEKWATIEGSETGIPSSKTINASGLHYCTDFYRNILTSNPYNWNITDEGPAHPVPNVDKLAPIASETPVAVIAPPTGTDPCTGALIIGQTTATFPITMSQTITWTFTNLNALVTEQTQFVYIGKPFITTWEITSPNESITIPAGGGTFNYIVEWGDATSGSYTGSATHEYEDTGTYSVRISGTFPHIMFNNGGSKNKIRTIQQWGDIQWSSMENAFSGCSDLYIPASDAPQLAPGTSMEGMFFEAGVSGNLSAWDVSAVTNMKFMFHGSSFNGNIGSWDVSNVANMDAMFAHSGFNGNINGWDVSGATNMNNMFANSVFNQSLNNWDVSNVTTMFAMFSWSQFNNNVSDWDVSSVTDMRQMFEHSPFSANISNWDVSSVTNMGTMLSYTPFNGDLSGWDVSNVTNMSHMFYWSEYNQSLGSWNISSVNNMENMFANAYKMTPENYESTLAGWASLDGGEAQIPTAVTLGADGLRYCNQTARTSLVNDRNWVIVNDIKNCRPTLNPVGNKNIDEDAELTFTVSGTDVETATPTFLLDQPSLDKGMVVNANGEFIWTPTNDHVGANEVVISISDGDLVDSETITITVANINDPPVITVGNQNTNEQELFSFTITIDDPDTDDLDVTLDATSLAKGMTITAAGVFSWTPTSDHIGDHNVTVTVDDGEFIDNKIFTITVAAVNLPPVLSAIGNKEANEDQPFTFTATATDPDDDDLTFSVDSYATSIGVIIDSDGVIYWTSTAEAYTVHSITITVSDGQLSDSETILLTSIPVNDPPTLAAIGNKTVDEDAALIFTVTSTDPDATFAATYSVDEASALKGMSFPSPGQFAWTPDNSHVGIHSVTITASDGFATDSETIAITVVGVNDAPVLSPIADKVMAETETLTFTVDATDVDNATLGYTIDATSSGKTMTINGTGEFSWTPGAAYIGTHMVTVTVSDGSFSDSESFSIEVTKVNVGPELPNLAAVMEIDADATLTFDATASDANDDMLTYSVDGTSVGKGMAITSGVFSWTPAISQLGVHDVTISVDDGELSDSHVFMIVVSSPNAPKLAAIGNKTVNEDEQLTFTATATDPDTQSLTFSLDPASELKGMTITTAGLFNWTPTLAMIGQHNITVFVSDGALTDLESFTITVIEANDLPAIVANQGLTLLRGEEHTITTTMLTATDEESATANIVYTIATVPVKGTLFNNTVAVAAMDNFTQADIDANKITYKHSGEPGPTDKFTFKVSDSDGGETAATDFLMTINVITEVTEYGDAAVTVYPMPAERELNIRLTNAYRGPVNFRLISTAGQSLLMNEVNKSASILTHTINLSEVSPGLHFLQIVNGDEMKTVKVVKR